MTGINSALCFVTAGALFFAAHLVAVQTSFVGNVFVAQHGLQARRTVATTCCCSAATPDRTAAACAPTR